MLIRYQGGEAPVTQADRTWLLRAVAAEGKPHEEVARTLVNLFAFLHSRGAYKTLADVVRAYAQPVNPRWYPSGDLYKKAVAGKSDAQREEELAKAERRERVHSRRNSFPAHVIAAVDAALGSGWPTDVTDYAAAWIDASHKYEPRSEPRSGFNRFWSRAPGWAGYVVTGTGGTGNVAAVLLVAGITVWALWEAKRWL